jgi:hypothetical protein
MVVAHCSILQLQIIPLNEAQELANLVRFRLAVVMLKAEPVLKAGVPEDVVAAADVMQVEAEPLDQIDEVCEGDVLEGSVA